MARLTQWRRRTNAGRTTAPEEDAMKVRDLIDILNRLDPEATVYIAAQPGYPVEYATAGVALRSELESEGEPEARTSPVASSRPSDVLIAEGSFERYGDRRTWEVARRR
jgi:hypothetical protein